MWHHAEGTSSTIATSPFGNLPLSSSPGISGIEAIRDWPIHALF